MSGAKRSSKYRKSVTEEYMNAFPEPEEDELIARVRASRGANVFEVELLGVGAREQGASPWAQLALLPNRFKNVIWVKRNDYLIVKGSSEEAPGDAPTAASPAESSSSGVQWEVQHVLSKDMIKHLRSVAKWPEAEFVQDVIPDEGDYVGMGGAISGSEFVEEEGEEEEQVLKKDARGNTLQEE